MQIFLEGESPTLKNIHMIRDTLIKFLFLRLEATSSKTLSLLQQN